MMLTAEQRSVLQRAQHTKAIRVTLYELGVLIGALYLADKAQVIWPQYGNFALIMVICLWVGFIVQYFRDSRSLNFIEKRLEDVTVHHS